MKIPPARIESFLQKPDVHIRAALFYGPDSGLIAERAKTLSHHITDVNDPFAVADFTFDAIKSDPAIIGDEMGALSFSGNRRLVRIKDAGAALPAVLKDCIAHPNGDTSFLIVTAEDLPPRAALRVLFETLDHAVAIPCYADDVATLGTVITTTLKARGYSCDMDALRAIQHSFSGDRLVVLAELEKLTLYMGEQTHITLADVQASLGTSVESSLDDICTSVVSCDNTTETVIKRALHEGISSIAILRALIRYFIRLHQVTSALENGAAEQQAMAQLRPPVFFKQVPVFKKHLSLWTSPKIEKVLAALAKAETDSKKTGAPAELLLSQLLVLLPLYRK